MKTALLNSTLMTPVERRMGRFMRAPDGHGGDSSASGDNTGVNPDSGTGDPASNTGQAFDYASFWDKKEEGSGNPDSGQGGDGVDAGKELGQQLVSQIQSYKASDVFTQEALQKMSDGDLTPLNEGINAAVQGSMKQMLGIVATLLERFESHQQTRFDQLVEGKLQSAQMSQKDESLLSENFKGFADPAMRPVIHGVFKKSLEHSGGDRSKALSLTRGMLETMGKLGREDMGIPRFANPDDGLDEGPARLVQELLAGRN
jgi:hypothetical protein